MAVPSCDPGNAETGNAVERVSGCQDFDPLFTEVSLLLEQNSREVDLFIFRTWGRKARDSHCSSETFSGTIDEECCAGRRNLACFDGLIRR